MRPGCVRAGASAYSSCAAKLRGTDHTGSAARRARRRSAVTRSAGTALRNYHQWLLWPARPGLPPQGPAPRCDSEPQLPRRRAVTVTVTTIRAAGAAAIRLGPSVRDSNLNHYQLSEWPRPRRGTADHDGTLPPAGSVARSRRRGFGADAHQTPRHLILILVPMFRRCH